MNRVRKSCVVGLVVVVIVMYDVVTFSAKTQRKLEFSLLFSFIHSFIYPSIQLLPLRFIFFFFLIFPFLSILLLLWFFFSFWLSLLFSFYFLGTRRPALAPISNCIITHATTHAESTTIRFDNDFWFIISTSQWIATVRSAEQFDLFCFFGICGFLVQFRSNKLSGCEFRLGCCVLYTFFKCERTRYCHLQFILPDFSHSNSSEIPFIVIQ